ncbi:TPA: hypothetical protein ACVBCY_004692, partial [Aeromonas hydrophila]
ESFSLHHHSRKPGLAPGFRFSASFLCSLFISVSPINAANKNGRLVPPVFLSSCRYRVKR